jgi:hypothetical protein
MPMKQAMVVLMKRSAVVPTSKPIVAPASKPMVVSKSGVGQSKSAAPVSTSSLAPVQGGSGSRAGTVVKEKEPQVTEAQTIAAFCKWWDEEALLRLERVHTAQKAVLAIHKRGELAFLVQLTGLESRIAEVKLQLQ